MKELHRNFYMIPIKYGGFAGILSYLWISMKIVFATFYIVEYYSSCGQSGLTRLSCMRL